MNKRITSFIKAYWIIIWMIIVAVALVSFSAYAAYIRTQNAKRVVSTMGGAGNRFSSNRLEEIENNNSSYIFRIIPVQGTVPNDGVSKPLTICNYPQGVEASFYPYNIYYDLEVELTDNSSLPPIFQNEATALTQYYIEDEAGTKHYFTKNENNRYVLIISDETLKGNKTSDITYMLHFPNVNTNVYMRTFAEPKIQNGLARSKPDDLKSLAAMITMDSVDRSQDTNWTGALVEPRASEKNVSDYDAYNYVISGAGAGTITLKWKSGMLELNQYFGDNDGITATPTDPDADGYMTLAFQVTADQTKNRYSFQMYKAKGSDWSSITTFAQIANQDNAANPLILFDFTAATQNQQQNQGG